MKKSEIKKIFFIFLAWRIGLFLVQIASQGFLKFSPRYTFLETFPQFSNFWSQWANFDGVHYAKIALTGYLNTGFIQAFFPTYPFLVGVVNQVFKNILFSGLFTSHLFALLAFLTFFKLIKKEFNQNIAWWSLGFLMLFPTSFYLVSFYNESLFLFLTLLTFLKIKQKKWWQAAILAAISSATRIVGLFLVIPLLLEYLKTTNLSKLKDYLKPSFLGLFSISGWLGYSYYLFKHFSDPFLYAHVQASFGAQRTTQKLVLLYQVIWRYLKMVITVQKNSWLYYTVWLELLTSLGVIGLLTWGLFKKIKSSWLIWSFLAVLLPTLTGTFSSMPRYVLVAFPIYVVLALIKSPILKKLIMLISGILLIVSTALFTQGYWLS